MGLANGGRRIHRRRRSPAGGRRPTSVPPRSGPTARAAARFNLVGSEAAKTGIYALLDVDLFNLLMIPETFDMTGGQEAGRRSPPRSRCANAARLLHRRCTVHRTLAPHRPASAWANWRWATRHATWPPTSRAVRIVDPLRRRCGRARWRRRARWPGSSRAPTRTRGVWKAPAGTDATLNGVLDLTLSDQRPRERRAQPARRQLPAQLPGLRPRRLGRAHAARRRRRGRRVEVHPDPPARALHRGEPVPRHAVGGVRAQRRAAVGADPAERRRLHERPVPPGRVPGHDAAARPTSSSATRRPPRRPTATSASSTSRSASRR